ncbi:MAG: tetratricopeptide repeat protein, partial [Candidatus Coatesbacteria bacterium]|nr:tetratricopeptide repeat protein [Candidatus Coatesbacteria bacterium]
NDPVALRELAKRAEASGNFDLAVAALERIQWEFSDQVDMSDLTFTLGEAYFTNQQFDKAKEAFAAYLRLNPKDEARRTEARYLSALSDFYFGDYGAAGINLFTFAKDNPGSEFAQVALAVAATACDDYHRSKLIAPEQKKEFFLGLTKRFPETQMAAEAQYYLGQLMVKAFKDYRSALGHFEAALAGNHCDEAAYEIGLCYELLGELDQAEKWLRKVIAESKWEGPRNLAKRALDRLQ